MNALATSRRDKRVRRILADVAGKRVAHLGCADSPFTKERLEKRSLLHLDLLDTASEIIGVDIDVDAMAALQSVAPTARLYTPESAPSHAEFPADVVIVGEVIEHIVDFVQFGHLLRTLSGPGTVLIVTTPNAYAFKATLRALAGVEQQHPDHKCLFSTATLEVMMNSLGFRLLKRSYYNNSPRSWRSVPLGWMANAILRAAPRASDGLYFTFEKHS
jgi:2-polyprenyl-3-methyl-5-hydroxy-6-metoxy-1,4-benzoquinol methylase